ncbi:MULTISPECIES: arginine N-succinyltransferase [Marinobacter]|jgi:arginine N-succinyltransferase|uniref:Arginine N-succinyltransferase n=1 Tax=Marinobacter salarius TaxID=1420917 RepID=W5YRX0_9GAMM|nr:MULTISPECIES: arginine N-succinyltransferase [Marinobacter]AHI31634.1 arginine N-succinyltransferase [Marinobacter salarius]MAB53837.1 arginine N-succinyltransferase [Marinobacter sp.]MBJ7277496.1 arginine N-succinyltransferase [Marinobacter salarius]|tara:strand:- start:791 stop:1807 length:1017 start_codon:yes stop_codon:yes gene_type:complete
MWLVRPAQPGDLNDILDIAGGQGPRMSSTLPKKQDALSTKIEQSTRSFAGTNKPDEPKRFLFVLEDTRAGKVQGVSGIDARAGNGQPFYNYRQDALIHASHELGVSRRVEVLYPSHALTDHTLLCSFAIRSELRATDAFELLSRARMLFIASHRSLFTDKVVVEIQGVQTQDGEVPFWDSLGRHFFNMDFETADQYSGLLSKTFIAELMPPNPIYVTLLSDAAREALGQPHSQTRATYELLQREGFRAGCYLDIFDAGPVLEARTDALKSVVTSHPKVLHAAHTDDGETCLISGGEGSDFRSTLTPITESLKDEVKVPPKTWESLGRSAGDTVRVTPL